MAAELGAGRGRVVRGSRRPPRSTSADLPPLAALVASIGYLLLHSPDEQIRLKAAQAIIDRNLDARRAERRYRGHGPTAPAPSARP